MPPQLPLVSILPKTGTFLERPTPVSLSVDGHPTAQIWYTLDGSSSKAHGVPYRMPFMAEAGMSICAHACAPGYGASLEACATYRHAPPAPCTLEIVPGLNPQECTVTLSCQPGATAYWSFNGSAPAAYAAPVPVAGPGKFLAYAERHGCRSSLVTHQFLNRLPSPSMVPCGRNFVTPTTIKMWVEGFDADIHYTVDGTNPTLESPKYCVANPPFFQHPSEVRAMAVMTGYAPSAVACWRISDARPVSVAVLGNAGLKTSAVACLARSKNPGYVVSTGNLAFSRGEDKHDLARLDLLDPLGQDVASRRLLTALGPREWDPDGITLKVLLEEYLTYLPGNRRYFDMVLGCAHFFFLSSSIGESELGYQGPSDPQATYNSPQGLWFRRSVQSSAAPWKVVVLHHSPYTAGVQRPGHRYLRWPFALLGIDAVLSGSSSGYERLLGADGVYYVNAGHGGASLEAAGAPLTADCDGAQTVFSDFSRHGMVFLQLSPRRLVLEAYAEPGSRVDELVLTK